jgi:hypothetical protein
LLFRQWELPVVVRTINLLEAHTNRVRGTKRIVFVGKPLPPKATTAMEKNRLAFKTAAKAVLFHSWTEDRPPAVVEVS